MYLQLFFFFCFACRVSTHGRCHVLLWSTEIAVLYQAVSRFLARLFLRRYHTYNRKTRPYCFSRQLFIQGHVSGNLSIAIPTPAPATTANYCLRGLPLSAFCQSVAPPPLTPPYHRKTANRRLCRLLSSVVCWPDLQKNHRLCGLSAFAALSVLPLWPASICCFVKTKESAGGEGFVEPFPKSSAGGEGFVEPFPKSSVGGEGFIEPFPKS